MCLLPAGFERQQWGLADPMSGGGDASMCFGASSMGSAGPMKGLAVFFY